MNVLDENIIDSQRRLLGSWRIPVRQTGYEIGRKGMSDSEIISLLHQLSRPTFFTRDYDFYDPRLRHAGYCLVYLDIRKEEVAVFVRRFLRHHSCRIKAHCMGAVVHVSHVGMAVWRPQAETETLIAWN